MRRSLTDRELEILRLIGGGHTSGEIAQTLGVSRRTIENQKRQIFTKLGVRSQAHAVALAVREGLLLLGQGRAPPRHLVVLGRPSPALARLASILGSCCDLPDLPDVQPVAVLVNPEPGHWQTTAELVGAGQVVLDPRQARMLVDAARGQLTARRAAGQAPTPREREILVSIDRGESVKQTARALGISVKTVENLQRRLFRRLGVRNRAQAVAAAHARG